MLRLVDLGWLPGHPYLGSATEAIVPHDPDWQKVGDIGNHVSDVADSHGSNASERHSQA